MNVGILPLKDSSTVLTSDFANVPSLPTYYNRTTDGMPDYNLYSALLHSTGELVYAFAFDDVAGASSLIITSDPTQVATVTLHSLAGITLPPLTGTGTYNVTLAAGAGASGSVTYDGNTLAFSNPAEPATNSPSTVNLPAAPATFTVSYDVGSGAQNYTINMVTQSACPFTGVVFSSIPGGGTQIAWPGAPVS